MYSRYPQNPGGGCECRPVRPQNPQAPDKAPCPKPEPDCPCAPPKPLQSPPCAPSGPRSGFLPGKLQKGDLLMLAILYLLLSEEDDKLLPLLAIALYLFIK